MIRTPQRGAWRRRVLGILLVTAVLGGLAGSPQPSAVAVGAAHYPIAGVGSSWSANALQQWIRNVWDNYKWKVTYDDSGSSAGRQQFGQQNGGKDFAVSEIPYALKDSDIVDPRPARQFAYMPIVAGGTALMYNLVIGGKKVTNLRLSGDVLAKIFTGAITRWDDAAIAADNPKLALPAVPIIPVVRSDGSGTTAQFTSWMFKEHPAVWQAYCAKLGKSNCGITSNYPMLTGSPFIARSGSNSVAAYVAQTHAQGSITYVEYSYALNARFPVAKILNSAGFYNEPTASNVAVALMGATINEDTASPDYLTQQLEGVYRNADARSYPLSSYSYMIVPTALEYGFTEDKGLTLADFTNYFLCEGQQQAEVLGYSPLPINLVQAGLNQVKKIPGGDPTGKDIAQCNNPTFSPDGSNKLAATAPQPQACDKIGLDQCATGTGGSKDTATAVSTAGGATAAAGTNAVTGSAATGANATDTAAAADASGAAAGGVDAIGGESTLAATVVAGIPVQLAANPAVTLSGIATVLASTLALVMILAPPFISRSRRLVGVRGPRRGPRGGRKRSSVPKIHLPLWRRPRSPDSPVTDGS
ncbi:phosphate ABC transporter substrate-binding protein PstS [Cryobacterium melibiosiphilum]|uniref:phosphate ABC transporter substrate-binding protein PstS n=1 Tax=Cryobacterium melibiosiphilum TaxID=995039 RepID=UPI0018F379C5|nr:phosphate ABC transporter substrate-binding protein PstS [Cryobacterium melibiosiphilum]